MRLPPADVLLSWPTPNYHNPVTRGPALVIINYIFASIAFITVLLRLYTRTIIKRWFGVDDVFIIIALIFTLGLTAVVLLANQRFGWNRHVWDIPFDQFEPTSKIAMTAKIVFTTAATFTRLSLHCFYYRLVTDTGKTWFRWMIHINVAYTFGIFISFPFIAIFMCTPIKAYWEIRVDAGNCMDEGVATLICGIINCVADFATTLTPMPLVIGLRMPRSQRFGVAVLFGLGIIVSVAGVVRTWFIYRSLFGEYDQTWYAYPLWIAAAIEIDLGVICASLPVLRPLLSKIPFSLSDTFSRGISFKKSSNPTSGGSGNLPADGSRPAPNTPALSWKRRADVISGAPELSKDRGKSYELKHWDDLEQGTTLGDTTRGSNAGSFEENRYAAERGGHRGLKKKVSSSGYGSDKRDDMTITKTSEIELQISDRLSRGNSYRPTIHRDPSPLPSEQTASPHVR